MKDPKGIVSGVCRAFRVSERAVMGKSRVTEVATARLAIYLRLKRDLGWGPSQIGRFMDRDHSTIIHGIRAIDGRMETDERLSRMVNGIKLPPPVGTGIRKAIRSLWT